MKKLFSIILMVLSVMAYTGCGDDGVDGLNGADGTNGTDGVDGQDGADGADGVDGQNGADGADGDPASAFIGVVPPNTSILPPLVNIAPAFINSVEVISIMSSLDTLPGSPDFVMAGNPDGAGLLDNGDGTYSWICNAENHWAVMDIQFDAFLRPLSASYVVNGDDTEQDQSPGVGTRLCSGTMARPDVHGFGPLFLTAGESGDNAQSFAYNPLTGTTERLVNLGRWSAENVVPLTQDAYPGQTVLMIMDDDSDSDGGQVVQYIANGVGNINDAAGSVGFLRPAGATEFMTETDITLGNPIAVEFFTIDGIETMTADQFEPIIQANFGFEFGRVEDADFGKGNATNNRTIYFAVTGQTAEGRTQAGRIYKLILDESDPTQGTLEVIVDGDATPSLQLQSPDNITVTENYAYFAEDPNNISSILFHDARIYQLDLSNNNVQVVFELNHGRNDPQGIGAFFGGGDARFGAWEYGAMEDVTDIMGLTNETCFILNLQIHTWDDDTGFSTEGVAGGSIVAGETEGGQIVAIKGLPR